MCHSVVVMASIEKIWYRYFCCKVSILSVVSKVLILVLVFLCKTSYIRVRQMVRKLLVNDSQTKCAYVWTGLRTCVAPSSNGSHTICHKPKFVDFLCEHIENWMCRVSFPCTGCSFARLRFMKN